MDKDNIKERLIGDRPPRLIDAEWDEGRTGTVTLTFRREGEMPFNLVIGTSCGDPYPQLVPDPEVRRRFLNLPPAKLPQIAHMLGMRDATLTPPIDFMERLARFVYVNDKSEEFERLVQLAESEGRG